MLIELPNGTYVITIRNQQPSVFIQLLRLFRGVFRISTGQGEGAFLIDRGCIHGAFYRERDLVFVGDMAVARADASALESVAGGAECTLMRYSEEEFNTALDISKRQGLGISSSREGSEPKALSEAHLNRIADQPGVIAVSACYEGYIVKSVGEGDFEQIAALAEELFRAGMKTVLEMEIGTLDQITLETGERKLIVVRAGDLCVCVIASNDANLGLVRIALKSISDDCASV
ncbi:MAG: roadblock/LC7 domain-containing protein [Methanomicrobiales archaeon]|nr:roadblock/LC7 domain-containing protein [Methanomicrobiales archaeon]